MCKDPTAGQLIYVVENSGYFISQVCIKVVPDWYVQILQLVSQYMWQKTLDILSPRFVLR